MMMFQLSDTNIFILAIDEAKNSTATPQNF
jgi:hypothetical protein